MGINPSSLWSFIWQFKRTKMDLGSQLQGLLSLQFSPPLLCIKAKLTTVAGGHDGALTSDVDRKGLGKTYPVTGLLPPYLTFTGAALASNVFRCCTCMCLAYVCIQHTLRGACVEVRG